MVVDEQADSNNQARGSDREESKVRNGENNEKNCFATQDVRQEACKCVGENTKNTGQKLEQGSHALSFVVRYRMNWDTKMEYHQSKPVWHS